MTETQVEQSLVTKQIAQQKSRWTALDILRGISVVGMLLALSPGAWDKQYSWLIHAKWEGGTLVDMVAPVFLFCIGAAIPLSLSRRIKAGAIKSKLLFRVFCRSFLLIVIGLFLNAYPDFDLEHLRIPGVLQRIGMGFGLSASVFLLTASANKGIVKFNSKRIAVLAGSILITYWMLLYLVPVPGYGAPNFDPVNSWPAVVDRLVFTTDHMFKWWPVNGKITFDPDGLVSTYPVLFNILLGGLAGNFYLENNLRRPVISAFLLGLSFMGLALLIQDICPVIKNIWTSSFALFSTGFALAVLAGLTLLCRFTWIRKLCYPAEVFGANPLLAYILVFVLMPLFDLAFINTNNGEVSLKWGSQLLLRPLTGEWHASFLFSVFYLSIILGFLSIFKRRNWFLRV